MDHGIQYLQGGGVGDPMMDQNQTSLGIFSVDELGNCGSEEEVQLYALMALINMSYHNLAVHNLVHQAGGVETILHLLGSSAFDVRKAAIFCLGNVVTGHKVKFFCIYKKKTPFLFRSNFFYFFISNIFFSVQLFVIYHVLCIGKCTITCRCRWCSCSCFNDE